MPSEEGWGRLTSLVHVTNHLENPFMRGPTSLDDHKRGQSSFSLHTAVHASMN